MTTDPKPLAIAAFVVLLLAPLELSAVLHSTETQIEVGLRAKLNADKSKKGKLKKGRKETACGISALFFFNRSPPILTQLSFSLSQV